MGCTCVGSVHWAAPLSPRFADPYRVIDLTQEQATALPRERFHTDRDVYHRVLKELAESLPLSACSTLPTVEWRNASHPHAVSTPDWSVTTTTYKPKEAHMEVTARCATNRFTPSTIFPLSAAFRHAVDSLGVSLPAHEFVAAFGTRCVCYVCSILFPCVISAAAAATPVSSRCHARHTPRRLCNPWRLRTVLPQHHVPGTHCVAYSWRGCWAGCGRGDVA